MQSFKAVPSILILIMASIFCVSAHGADETEFKNSGEFRVRYFNDMNATATDASGQAADTTARIKLNFAARKGERLQAFITVLHNSQFGSQNTDTGDYTNVSVPASTTTPPAPTTDASTNNILLVNRAWGLWKTTESLSFRAGRFGIEIADGAVFSENNWENVPTAHEGLEMVVDMDPAKLSFYTVKTGELSKSPLFQSGAPSSDPERNLYIVSADLKNLPEVFKMVNLHFVDVVRDKTNDSAGVFTGSQNWQHIGFTLAGDVGHFNYKITGAYQTGFYSRTDALDQHLSASMYDLLIGYSLPESANFKVEVGYHRDSGNSENATTAQTQAQYQTLYYEKHDYSGLMDVIGWGNLSYVDLVASFQPADEFEVGLGYYLFSRTNAGDPATATGPALGDRYPSLATGDAIGETRLGSEIDLFGNKSYDTGFKLGGRLGTFLPDSYFKNGTTGRGKPLLQAMVQASFEF